MLSLSVLLVTLLTKVLEEASETPPIDGQCKGYVEPCMR